MNILITGAATGIGAATAKLLACRADNLILHTGSNTKSLEKLKVKLKAQLPNCKITLITGDLAKASTFEVIQSVVDELEGIDTLINCAGFPEWSKFGELTSESLQRSLDINVKAFHHLVSILLPHFHKSKNARIIAVTDIDQTPRQLF